MTDDGMAGAVQHESAVDYYAGSLSAQPIPARLQWTADDVIRVRTPLGEAWQTAREVPLGAVRSAALVGGTLTMRVDGQPMVVVALDPDQDPDAPADVATPDDEARWWAAALREHGVRVEDSRHISLTTVLAALGLFMLAVVVVAVLI